MIRTKPQRWSSPGGLASQGQRCGIGLGRWAESWERSMTFEAGLRHVEAVSLVFLLEGAA